MSNIALADNGSSLAIDSKTLIDLTKSIETKALTTTAIYTTTRLLIDCY